MESHAPAHEASPESLLALRARYRRLESRRSGDGAQLWLNWAIALHDGTILGIAQATVPADQTSVEIAYVLGRPFWSHGFASEALSAMINCIEESFGSVEFTATVDCRNVASGRLLGRLGFVTVDAGDPQNVRWLRPSRKRIEKL